MRKIKDRLILGAVSGVLAGVPDTLINALEHRAGLSDLSYGQMGANIFMPGEKINRIKSQLAGYLANATLTGLSGVIFAYMLAATGRDRPLLKGIGFGMASWLLVYGLGSRMGLQVQSNKPLAPLLSVIDHVIFGSMLGLITPKLGDDALFPGGAKIGASGNMKPDQEPHEQSEMPV